MITTGQRRLINTHRTPSAFPAFGRCSRCVLRVCCSRKKGSGVPRRRGVPDGGRRRNFGTLVRSAAGAGADGPSPPRKVLNVHVKIHLDVLRTSRFPTHCTFWSTRHGRSSTFRTRCQPPVSLRTGSGVLFMHGDMSCVHFSCCCCSNEWNNLTKSSRFSWPQSFEVVWRFPVYREVMHCTCVCT